MEGLGFKTDNNVYFKCLMKSKVEQTTNSFKNNDVKAHSYPDLT